MTDDALGDGRRHVDAVLLVRAIARRWWLVVLVVLLGAAGGAFLGARSTPQFAARVMFFVGDSSQNPGSVETADELAQARNHTLAVLTGSSILSRRIVSTQHLHVSSGVVSSEVSASAEADTVLLDVTVRDPSQHRALAIATGLASELPKVAATLYASSDSAGGTSGTSFTVVNGPRVSSTPQTHTRITTLLGVLAGLVAGVGVAVLAELRDHRVRTVSALALTAGAPALGTVSFDPALGAGATAEVTIGALAAEELRRLRTAVQFLSFSGRGSVLVFAAPTPGGGASTVVAHLARVVAQAGKRVCVVDANLRSPGQARAFGLGPVDGLSSVLAGRATVVDVVHRVADGLDVVPGGPRPPNPSELLGTTALDELLSALRADYDVVLVDGAPVLPFTDSAVLGRRTDGIVLVARYGRSTVSSVESTTYALRTARVALAGVVLTMAPPGGDGYASDGVGVDDQVTTQRIDTNPKPTTEISDSITDQVLNV